MKKLFQKILMKVFRKAVKKTVSAAVESPDLIVSATEPVDGSKKAFWKFLIQTLISILTAILTALGTTSCMGIH